MRVRCLGNDNMEWMRIELSIEDGLNIHGEVPNNPNPGLDVTAEIMHNSFLSNMPHLEEVNNTHKSIISEISDTIKSEKISSRSNKSLDLFLVPSNSIIRLSISDCFVTSNPIRASEIIELIFLIAFLTPLPRYRFLSKSLNSIASCSPVEAPDGTAALPKCLDSVITSTSIVGFPLESRISLAYIFSILEFNFYSFKFDLC